MRRVLFTSLALVLCVVLMITAGGCPSGRPVDEGPRRKPAKSVPPTDSPAKGTPTADDPPIPGPGKRSKRSGAAASITLEAVPADAPPDAIPLPPGISMEVVGDPPAEAAPAAAPDSDASLDERPEDAPPRIIVKWGIETAVDNFGYIVFRAEDAEGEYKAITRGILPGVGTTSIPQTMRYADTDVQMGTTYYYKVEEIGRDGGRTMFPDAVTNQVMVLRGEPKRMSRREQQMFADNPFVIMPTPR